MVPLNVLCVALLGLAGCAGAQPPAVTEAPAPVPARPSAPVAPAAAPAASAPARAADPSPAVTVVINAAAARDERFCWFLADDTWRLARTVARLKLPSEVDWLAAAHWSGRPDGDVVLVHHLVDPKVMEQVFDLEGARETSAQDGRRVWRPRGVRRGVLLWEIDPSTIAFGSKTALAAAEQIASLRSLAEENSAPFRLTVRRPQEATATTKGVEALRIELGSGAGEEIDVTVAADFDDASVSEAQVARVRGLLASRDADEARPGSPFDRLEARAAGQTVRLHGHASKHELVEGVLGFLHRSSSR